MATNKISKSYLQSVISVFAVLLVLTVAFLIQRYVRVSVRELYFDWMLEVRRNSFIILSLGLFSPLVFHLYQRFPLTYSKLNWNFLVHVLLGILFAFIHVVFVSIVNGGSEAFAFSQKVFLNFFHIEVLSYWLILAVAHFLNRNKDEVEKISDGASLMLKSNGVPVRLDYNDIIKIQAYDHYLKIHTTSETFIYRHSMSGVEKILSPHGFIRIHRSWIVNAASIQAIQKSLGQVILNDGCKLTMGRTYKKMVEKKLNHFAKKIGH